MSKRFQTPRVGQPSLFIVLLVLLFATLAFAGGSYRSEAPGQVVVRLVAGIIIIIAVMTMPKPDAESRAPLLLLAAIALVPTLQLVPLPSAWWAMLPGRSALANALATIGQPSGWRPASWSPATTANALFSLIVPASVLLIAAALKEKERRWPLHLLMVIVVISALTGLIQFSGNRFEQPLIRYDYEVSGTFGNRNHFALFLALGCLAIPSWIWSEKANLRIRMPIGIGLIIVLILTVMASGSRAGLAMTGLAILIGPLIVREDVGRIVRARARWVAPATAAGTLFFLAGVISLSVFAGRAQSIDRLMTADVSSDMRARGLPTVLAMTKAYFPVGIGMGSFDDAFRHHEPFALLKLTYFNQAHNDVLSTVLEGGLPGLIVLLLAMIWWVRASLTVWRSRNHHGAGSILTCGRLGSAMIAFVFAASIVDYPARTPMMMAVVALAAAWLAWGRYYVRRD